MAKKVVGKIKLQIEAGKANPSPPVGPALGQHGVNIMDFCKQFNARTESQAGYIIPVVIDVYEDRSFTFVTKSPPVGPALGQHGVNIMDFCKQFNARTESQAGYIIPVVIDVYEDRSFTFVTKSPPAPVLIKKALNLSKGSAVPNKNKVAEITREQLEEIAKIKMNDLNATTMEAAVEMIKGSCRAMGVTVKEG